jgi:hypothetical protein
MWFASAAGACVALSVVGLVSASPSTARKPAPNFAHDIAAILFEKCATCHHPGEPAPFSLLTYADARRHARDIAAVTHSRRMPPWLPEYGHGDFSGEQRLTEAQISAIADWAAAGAPEGHADEVPPSPQFPGGWRLGPPDMIVEAAHSFSVPASGADVFWNFIFTPPVATTRYVRAVEIRPMGAAGASIGVHHANLLIDRARSARRFEKEPGAGFPGMEVTLERTTFDFDSHFLFWKPGSSPYEEPAGMAWRLDPGNDLVLNTHLQPSGRAEQVRPSLGLYFTDKSPDRFPLLIQLEGDGRLDIPAGVRDFAVSDDFRLPVDAEILAVYPHAHYLGHLLEGYATLPSGARKWLIRIPEWDLRAQSVFRYSQPVFLPKGAIISMRYHYDNSAANPLNPNHPPRRVQAGNQATDEMAHLWLQILPRGPGDQRMVVEEALMRHRLEKYPQDYAAHLKLGSVMLARLNAAGAEPMLEAATRIDPAKPEAHNLLGAALSRLGRTREAMSQFEIALRQQPDYQNARYNLANAQLKAGKLDEAIANFRQVVAAFPNDADAKARLATALEMRAKVE